MEDRESINNPRLGHTGLSIRELFFKYIRFLPLYIISVAIALLGAYLYLRYTTEFYSASGQILIRDDNSTPSLNDRVEQAIQSNNQKNIQTEIEILQSRQLMERTVESLSLNYNYYSTGKIKELNTYKVAPFRLQTIALKDSATPFRFVLNFISNERFTVNNSIPIKIGDQFRNEFGQFRIVRVNQQPIAPECRVDYNPTPSQASMLLQGLVVVPKQTTGILTVVMESTNPQLSADVINSLMEEYQQLTIEEKNASTRKSIDFIDSDLKKRANELDSLTHSLVAYQKEKNIILPETQAQNYFTRLEDARKDEQVQRLLLNNALQVQTYLRSNRDDLVPSSLGLSDPTLNALVENYNKTQLERKSLLENAQPGHIIIQQKNEEVTELRNKILENIKGIQTSYASAISSLNSTSNDAVAQLETLPNKTQDLLDIQNQIKGKMELYNEMMAKRDLDAISLASTISNTKVIENAAPNATPIKPNRKSTRIMAVLIGLLIPTLIILSIELFNDKINSTNDIQRLTDTVIIGEVGHSFSDKTLVVTSGNRKVIAEQFRILRSNLQYVLTKAPKPVIMVTSSFSGEGKSFISTNIGAVMALANKKTIILEFDIRKPKIVSGLGLPKSNGLTNYIIGKVTAEELPVLVPGYDNLYVLPCGPIPPNPAELLLDSKLEELFKYLHQNFDVVIMDTAPVGMVSDAMTLSRFADCTLYIVRQGHTYKKQIALVDNYNREGKLPKISLVVNDVKVQAGYGAYGYGNSYGYGYGSGYFEEESGHKTGFRKWFGWLGMNNSSQSKKRKSKQA